MSRDAIDAPAPHEITAAVREILAAEVLRVTHPGPREDDREGWHPMSRPDPDAPGHPVFDPETWRCFRLRDVAVIDGLILIAFEWTEAAAPPLTYLVVSHPRPGSVHAAATSARAHLRQLLRPGWRDRVDRQWLDPDRVLITAGRRRRSPQVEEAIAADLDRRWTGGIPDRE